LCQRFVESSSRGRRVEIERERARGEDAQISGQGGEEGEEGEAEGVSAGHCLNDPEDRKEAQVVEVVEKHMLLHHADAVCPRTTMYFYIGVLILLYTSVYVSSYYYIPLYRCPHTALYLCICVLILLHTSVYVSSYYYIPGCGEASAFAAR
jgi:hypothetical protein